MSELAAAAAAGTVAAAAAAAWVAVRENLAAGARACACWGAGAACCDSGAAA